MQDLGKRTKMYRIAKDKHCITVIPRAISLSTSLESFAEKISVEFRSRRWYKYL